VKGEVQNINLGVMERLGAGFDSHIIVFYGNGAVGIDALHWAVHFIVAPVPNHDRLVTHENTSAA
jgi:hypothetical protein